jgi:hypothetical protein
MVVAPLTSRHDGGVGKPAAPFVAPEACTMFTTILLILLILLLLGAFPRWRYSREWGYGPAGGVGTILIIVLVLALIGLI